MLSQNTIEAEDERKKIKITDSSQDLWKDELVKTYNLRKKDKPEIIPTGSENSVLENKANDGNEDTGSKNTDNKDEPLKNNGNKNELEIVIDALLVQNENVQESDRSGNIESGQDSAYRTEQESTEVTGSTVFDDTIEDPDFDAEKEQENSTDITVTTEEKSEDQITGNMVIGQKIRKYMTKLNQNQRSPKIKKRKKVKVTLPIVMDNQKIWVRKHRKIQMMTMMRKTSSITIVTNVQTNSMTGKNYRNTNWTVLR